MWAEILASAGVGLAGSLIGGSQASSATDKALKLQKKQAEQTREDLSPWRRKGEKALGELWNYIQNPELVTEMPGYEFAFGEGTKALLRSASATGNLASGATGKALTRYGQDYGTTKWLDYLRPYQELSAQGQSAAAQTGTFAQNYANQASQNILAGGAARAGTIGNITNTILSGIKDYYYLSELDKLKSIKKPTNWRDYSTNYLS